MGDTTRDFTQFRRKLRLNRRTAYTPIDERSYERGYRMGEAVPENLTIEQINSIIRSGDISELRMLSDYFYRICGEYRNNIDYLASLPLYDTVVIPLIKSDKLADKTVLKTFEDACAFIEKLDVPNTFTHITKQWIKRGVYYGILRTDGIDVVVQELPLDYCRTRFKDFNNLNVLEFNLNYFEHITDEELRKQLISTFPPTIQKAWTLWRAHRLADPWVIIPALEGGVCFTFIDDPTPLLVGSIPALKALDDALKREEKRDENELRKLLIQRMPIDKDGELVFQLEEVADIHESVADMLQDIDTVDVLTTFGDTDLENLQETSAATQSSDRIAKYKDNAYDALGRSSMLFNATNSASLAYSIKKDESLMISYLNQYETWIRYHLNNRFAHNGLQFDFEILPTTVFNRTDIQSAYFRGAQYGYSKMFAGVALGIKQRDQLSLMSFENDYLQMSAKMVPLQSSYTTSGTAIAGEEAKGSTTTSITAQGTGGRPELPDEQKSDKTQANIEAAG